MGTGTPLVETIDLDITPALAALDGLRAKLDEILDGVAERFAAKLLQAVQQSTET